jgi:glutamate 5-kinase
MKKIVIKISSNLLNPKNHIDIIEKLALEIKILIKKHYKIIIVTSGAVMHGLKALKLDKKPDYVPLLQGAASIGQIKLMNRYQTAFEKHDLIAAQILVSADDFRIRKRYLNLKNTIQSLLDIGAIPIFNENDSVNTEELKFGDNDHLSALITIMADFELLVILTNVKGLFNKDPNINKDAEFIPLIENLNQEYLKFASSKTSEFTTGGMKTKIEASLKSVKSGINVFIGQGLSSSLLKIIDRKETGTYILSNAKKTHARKKWLGTSPTVKGDIYIDNGAYDALKNNSSLLASGIISVKGNFQRASLINIHSSTGKVAQGLSNYSSKEKIGRAHV